MADLGFERITASEEAAARAWFLDTPQSGEVPVAAEDAALLDFLRTGNLSDETVGTQHATAQIDEDEATRLFLLTGKHLDPNANGNQAGYFHSGEEDTLVTQNEAGGDTSSTTGDPDTPPQSSSVMRVRSPVGHDRKRRPQETRTTTPSTAQHKPQNAAVQEPFTLWEQPEDNNTEPTESQLNLAIRAAIGFNNIERVVGGLVLATNPGYLRAADITTRMGQIAGMDEQFGTQGGSSTLATYLTNNATRLGLAELHDDAENGGYRSARLTEEGRLVAPYLGNMLAWASSPDSTDIELLVGEKNRLNDSLDDLRNSVAYSRIQGLRYIIDNSDKLLSTKDVLAQGTGEASIRNLLYGLVDIEWIAAVPGARAPADKFPTFRVSGGDWEAAKRQPTQFARQLHEIIGESRGPFNPITLFENVTTLNEIVREERRKRTVKPVIRPEAELQQQIFASLAQMTTLGILENVRPSQIMLHRLTVNPERVPAMRSFLDVFEGAVSNTPQYQAQGMANIITATRATTESTSAVQSALSKTRSHGDIPDSSHQLDA